MSRIEIAVEAGITAPEERTMTVPTVGTTLVEPFKSGYPIYPPLTEDNSPYISLSTGGLQFSSLLGESAPKRIVTNKGNDVFEVLWSAEIAMNKKLKKSAVEDITHIALTYKPTSSTMGT